MIKASKKGIKNQDVENLLNDFKKVYVETRIETIYEDAFILDYIKPIIIGSVEIIDSLKKALINNDQELSDQDKKRVFIISSIVSILKASGKCCIKYLENLEVIASSSGNPILDPLVNKIINSIYVKLHILIPKDPLVKCAMIILINGGVMILKKIYKLVKIYYLNNFVSQEVHKLERTKPIKYFDKLNEDIKIFDIKKKTSKYDIEINNEYQQEGDEIEITPTYELSETIDF